MNRRSPAGSTPSPLSSWWSCWEVCSNAEAHFRPHRSRCSRSRGRTSRRGGQTPDGPSPVRAGAAAAPALLRRPEALRESPLRDQPVAHLLVLRLSHGFGHCPAHVLHAGRHAAAVLRHDGRRGVQGAILCVLTNPSS